MLMYPVVQKINLTLPLQFAVDRVADDPLVVTANHRLHRDAVEGRGFKGGHVLRSHEREVKRARDRRGREGEEIDELELLLEFLLVEHAEPLLLVDHHQAEVFELHVLRDEPVRADHDIDASFAQPLHGLALLSGRAEPAQHGHVHRIIGHPLAEGLVMLLGQHRGRREHGDLLAVHHRLERGADRHLRLAEADIAADEPVHRALGFHVGLGRGDRGKLVGGFLVQKRVFKLLLPFVVRREREAGARFPLGMDGEQLGGIIKNRALGGEPGLRPAPVAEFAQRGRSLPDAHVARDEERLLQRDVKPRRVCKFDCQHFLVFFASLEFLQAEIPADAVFEMHDEVALVHLTEVDLRPAGLVAHAPQREPAGAGVAIAAEQFGIGEHRDFCRREGEAARNDADGER